jgi:hypothetical protein
MKHVRRATDGFSNASTPSTRTVPADGFRYDASALNRLVLPEPLRPSTP